MWEFALGVSWLRQSLKRTSDSGFYEVKDKVERLPIKLLDLVQIASILLNNAIESAIDSLEKIVHVSLVQLDDRTIFVWFRLTIREGGWRTLSAGIFS